MVNRYSNAGSFRYGFNGKEKDWEDYGEGNGYDYGARVYNSRIGRFLSTDPLFKDFPWYSPYQFAGNKPIWATDLDGMEEQSTSGGIRIPLIPFISPYKPRTPGQLLQSSVANSLNYVNEKWSHSRAGKFTNGLINTTFGLVGTISSVAYISGSDGAGAPLGGAIALQLSLGETGIGVSQMTEALTSNLESNEFLHNSSTIPGLIAYGSNFKYAPFVDAISSLGPTVATSNGLRALMQDGFGLVSAYSAFSNNSTILNALGAIDQTLNVSGAVLESVNLVNDFVTNGNGRLLGFQNLDYQISYTAKKGDNLISIAKKLNTTVDALIKQNGISDPDKIQTGQTIKYANHVTAKINDN